MLKDSIKKAYGKKGDKIVAQNCAAVDSAVSAVHKIEIPASWAAANDAPEGRLGAAHTPEAKAAAQKGVAHFLEEVVKPVFAMEGDKLPVRYAFLMKATLLWLIAGFGLRLYMLLWLIAGVIMLTQG